MASENIKKRSVDEARIGDYAAHQPLSGISRVDETGAVNGLGRGGFVRKEEADKEPANKR